MVHESDMVRAADVPKPLHAQLAHVQATRHVFTFPVHLVTDGAFCATEVVRDADKLLQWEQQLLSRQEFRVPVTECVVLDKSQGALQRVQRLEKSPATRPVGSMPPPGSRP